MPKLDLKNEGSQSSSSPPTSGTTQKKPKVTLTPCRNASKSNGVRSAWNYEHASRQAVVEAVLRRIGGNATPDVPVRVVVVRGTYLHTIEEHVVL